MVHCFLLCLNLRVGEAFTGSGGNGLNVVRLHVQTVILVPPSLLLLDHIQEIGNLFLADTNPETENVTIFFSFFCTLFLSSNSLFILFFKLFVSPPVCLPLSDTPQALKALQDMSLTSPCSPPPLHSMRHSKSIPVQAFEVCTDIHQTCTPTYCTSLPAVSLQCDAGQYYDK